MRLEEHLTVRRYQETHGKFISELEIDAEELRQLCLEAGADDVGFVEIERPEIADQRKDIEAVLPGTRTLISIVCRMNREPIRSSARSVANLEFHRTGDEVNEAGARIVAKLEERGIRAINPSMGFPMEMDRWGEKLWVVSHKPVAVAAGLGQVGIHRNIIHPKFGNFILIGTIITDARIKDVSEPIDYNPCLECKLCVAACPVGAISPDGQFNFSACYTHNYREFMGGFTDWVETLADSRSAKDYGSNVTDAETVSMWQSLSFGANYKAAYCLAVCPAGDDVIGPYLRDKKEYLHQVVRPLTNKEENLYVIKGSDAEKHGAKRFPHKPLRIVSNSLKAMTISQFLFGTKLTFERGKSKDLDATYQFTFTGKEAHKATIIIRDQKIEVEDGHIGKPDFQITADTQTWLGFVAKERNLFWALLRRKIKTKGPLRLFLAFGQCFP